MGASWLPQGRTSLPLVDVRSPSFLNLLGLRATGYKVCRLCTLSLSLSLSPARRVLPWMFLGSCLCRARRSWLLSRGSLYRRGDRTSSRSRLGSRLRRSWGSRFKSFVIPLSNCLTFPILPSSSIHLFLTRSARVSYSRLVFSGRGAQRTFLRNFSISIANSHKSPR